LRQSGDGEWRDSAILGHAGFQTAAGLAGWTSADRRDPRGNEIDPGTEAPNLRSQLMRAAMSIPATVAEGAGRETRADFARFVSMAIASASEVEHHLEVCDDLGLIERSLIEQLIDRVTRLRRMLFGLRRTLLTKEGEEAGRRNKSSRQPRPDPPPAD
jgi:four helix bundle protein